MLTKKYILLCVFLHLGGMQNNGKYANLRQQPTTQKKPRTYHEAGVYSVTLLRSPSGTLRIIGVTKKS